MSEESISLETLRELAQKGFTVELQVLPDGSEGMSYSSIKRGEKSANFNGELDEVVLWAYQWAARLPDPKRGGAK